LHYPNYEIIVVDNGSTDGTSNAIKELFPKVTLVKSKRNLGVTGGRNLGARQSSGGYVFFLDHDTTIDENALHEIVAVMQSDLRIGIAGPAVYYYDDPKRIWALGTSVNMLTGKVTFNQNGKVNGGRFAKGIEVEVLPTAFLVRKEVMNKVGLFDDTFFAVYEDTDFCFRAKESGYKVLCVPTSRVWHKVSLDEYKSIAGVLRRAYFVSRNRIIFMKKHSDSFLAFVVLFLPFYLMYYSVQAVCLSRIDWLKSFLKGSVNGTALALKLH